MTAGTVARLAKHLSLSFAHCIPVLDAMLCGRAPARIQRAERSCQSKQELSNGRTENVPIILSNCRYEKHFTTFVCQRILKSKQWLKSPTNVPSPLSAAGRMSITRRSPVGGYCDLR